MYDTEQAVLQNLNDAGCDPETIQKFLSCWKAGKTADQLRLLAEQRNNLLDYIHKNEKCIDCLDYLVYQIEKERLTVPCPLKTYETE